MNFDERVIKAVEENIEKKCTVSADTKLIEDLGVDSFNKMMIIAALEDEFSIEIDVDDFSSIETVGDIMDKLKKAFPGIEGE